MRIHDAISGLFFMALGIAVLLIARHFPQMPGQSIGPATFPLLIGTGLLAGGAIVALLGLRRTARSPVLRLEAGWRHPRHVATVAFAVLGTAAHAQWFEQLGFPAGAVLLCVGLLALAGIRKPSVHLLVLVFVAAVTMVMTRVLSVPLPMGSWL